MFYFAYAMAWISTSIATIAGMYFTHSAWCLLTFIFPACIGLTHESKNNKESEDKEDEQSED